MHYPIDRLGLNWGPQIPLPSLRSSHGPGITGYRRPGSPSPDDLFLAWKGEESDERLFYARGFDGSSFATIERLEGHSSNARPAVAEFQGRVHMVWTAATGEHVLWSSWANGSWAPVKVIPNVFTTHAPALTPFGNDLILCWKGMGTDTRDLRGAPAGRCDGLAAAPAGDDTPLIREGRRFRRIRGAGEHVAPSGRGIHGEPAHRGLRGAAGR